MNNPKNITARDIDMTASEAEFERLASLYFQKKTIDVKTYDILTNLHRLSYAVEAGCFDEKEVKEINTFLYKILETPRDRIPNETVQA